MNTEQLIIQAAGAIADWARHHDEGCALYIKNSAVVCSPLFHHPALRLDCLNISTDHQKFGFISAQWKVIGNELLKLYKEDKLCQKRLKH